MTRFVCLATTILMGCGPAVVEESTPAAAPSPPPLAVVVEDPPVVEYVGAVMDVCRPKLSAARRTVLAQQVARVASDTFPARREAEAFVALVCIESRFDGAAKSSAGAVGLTQIMPQYASGFAEGCGLGAMDAGDLHDTEFNLRLGACVFRGLLDRFGGNVALALSAYNSGAASTTTARLGQLGAANLETANYVARYLVVREAARQSAH